MLRKIELSAAYARLALQSGVAPAAELLRGVASTENELADAEFIEAAELGILFRNYDRCVNDCAWTARLGSQFSINLGIGRITHVNLQPLVSDIQSSRAPPSTLIVWPVT